MSKGTCRSSQTAQESQMEAEQGVELVPDGDPIALFAAWYGEARESEPSDSNSMALATATSDGLPSVRMVLLKGFAEDGFVFYTDSHSRKGGEILANPNAALLFHWKSLGRQIRIEGPLSRVGEAAADAYFASRARDSQLGAVASDQSAALVSRQTFIARYEEAKAHFDGRDVERPPHWFGFQLEPKTMEFWHDRPFRLHERRLFNRGGEGWTSTLLYP